MGLYLQHSLPLKFKNMKICSQMQHWKVEDHQGDNEMETQSVLIGVAEKITSLIFHYKKAANP